MAAAVAAFVVSLAVCLAAAEILTRGLTRLGLKAGLTEGLVGLLAALGADAPELSSAVTAIVSGAPDVGVGVVLGSNLFNLAALLGLSAIVAAGVRIRRAPLLLDASVGLAVLLPAALALTGMLEVTAAAVPAVVVFAAYALLLGRFHGLGRRVWPNAFETVTESTEAVSGLSWAPVLLVPIAVAGVLAGSVGMVRAALQLAAGWHLGAWLVGSVILAGLTSLPNLYVAIHFARAGRGTALVSAAMNSNAINILGGIYAPGLVLGLRSGEASAGDIGWLLLLTALVVVAAYRRARLGVAEGLLVIGVYAAFLVSGVVMHR